MLQTQIVPMIDQIRIYFSQSLRNKLLTMVWLGIAVLPAFGLCWVKEEYPNIPSALMTMLIIGYLCYCVCALYLYVAVIHHLDHDPTLSFWGALKRGMASLRLLLRFVPVIGSLFEPDEDKTHYDPDDE